MNSMNWQLFTGVFVLVMVVLVSYNHRYDKPGRPLCTGAWTFLKIYLMLFVVCGLVLIVAQLIPILSSGTHWTLTALIMPFVAIVQIITIFA